MINAAECYQTYLLDSGRGGLSAEDLTAFLRWMRNQAGRRADSRLAESTRRRYAMDIADFFEWASGEGLLELVELDDADARRSLAFRGFSRRQRQAALERAVAPEVVRRLFFAIRLEIVAGEAVLAQSPAESAVVDPVLPLLPFPLLCGILLGVRSAEWNALQLRDVEHHPEQLWVHAPNKRPASLYMVPEVMRAWKLAEAWQRRYRSDWNPTSAAVMMPLSKPGRSGIRTHVGLNIPEPSGEIGVLDTVLLRGAIGRFYRKYFLLKQTDGTPVLYRPDPSTGNPVPLNVSFVDYRAIAINEYRRHEPNPEKLRVFARHEALQTTFGYYVRETPEEVREHTAETLEPFSERVRLRVLGRVATPDEMAAATDAGALVPGGGCQEALSGIRGCRRAIDCRLCKHHLIDPRTREFYVLDAQRHRGLASRAREANQHRSVQVHQSFAALNDAHVEMIDLYAIGAVG